MLNIFENVNLLNKSNYKVSLCMLTPLSFGMEDKNNNIEKNNNDIIKPLEYAEKNKIRDFFNDLFLEYFYNRRIESFINDINFMKTTINDLGYKEESELMEYIKGNSLNQNFWFSVFKNDEEELNKIFYNNFDKELYNIILSKLNEKNDFKDIKNENVNINQNDKGCFYEKNYSFCQNIGSGGFSNVILAGFKEYEKIQVNIRGKQLKGKNILGYKDMKVFKISKNDEYFKNECEILSKCDHPNIIKSYFSDVIKKDSLDVKKEDIACLSLEYCEKGDLWELASMGKNNYYSECIFCYVTGQLFKGLLYLHNNGIAHFDIKPANILINKNLDVKIADFSISKEYPKNNSLNKNIFFPNGGTEHYMAPEIINEAMVFKKEDFFKPDVYSWAFHYIKFLQIIILIGKQMIIKIIIIKVL